jgi:Protein of unknown function (DUF998)
MMIAAISAYGATVCYSIVVALFFVFHFVDRNHSPLKNAVSEYGIGGTASMFVVYGLVGSLGALLLALATLKTSAAIFPKRVPLYLVLLAVLRLGVLRFHTDMQGEKRTKDGRFHFIFAIATFALTYMTVTAAQPTVDAISESTIGIILETLSWTAAISLVAVVVALLTPLRAYFGVVERIFLLSTALWLLTLSSVLALTS